MSKQDDDDLECAEFVEHVTDLLDGALGEETEHRVVAHLAQCDGCTEYLEQFKVTVDALGRLPAERVTELPEPARSALLAAFREARIT